MSSRNRHAQELHEQTTMRARFSDWKLLSRNTHIMMWAICNSVTRRYLPSNSQNNWLYRQLSQQRRKTSQQNPFAHHQHSVTVSDDVRMQVKIGLHQFDVYLSQVKINVKQSTTATLKISGDFFIFQQDIPQARRVRAWDNQLSCLKLSQMLTSLNFLQHTQQWICSKFSLKMPEHLKCL